MIYKASFGNATKILTFAAIVLFAVIGYQVVKDIMTPGTSRKAMFESTALLLFMPVVYIGSFLLAPRAYKIDDDYLTIIRSAGNKKIKLADIKTIRAVADTDTFFSIRVFANGGLFGYYGIYYVFKIGWVTYYTTQRNNRILIETLLGKKFLITPDDSANMIEDLKSKLKTTL